MRLPGTLEHLRAALDKNGWGQPSELRFDADGNLTGILLQPKVDAPPEAKATQEPGKVRRMSPLSIMGRPPIVSE